MTRIIDPVYTEGEEVTEAVEDILGPLIHAEGVDGHVRRVGVTGVNNNEVLVSLDTVVEKLEAIVTELKIMNIHLSTITDEEVRQEDIE